MSTTKLSDDPENLQQECKKNFICGVIEGFYGRPWTTEQRKDLFRKMKKWNMDSYVYAPKDDYKHRAFWRELYTVEEADHLSSLIAAAKEQGVMFYYALSPGLDMTYSSQKEILTLKRKLDQVSQFGCGAFALLFDDIESELSKADKEVFQTFANAQVSVTNEIFTHLGSPKFLFCPTQYCSSRAVTSVNDSEYLNTLAKLNHEINIMWTGSKVISKTITLQSIQEITEVLRRKPVIWDNLHANDYDQKRVFLGPYCGRSPELIPHLRGVMTNPNCEFHANTIAIHTLAYWSHCSMDSKVNSSISADIKLETENDDGTNSEDLPTDCCISKNIYHPRIALKNAIAEWLPEFHIQKEASGPITKPQPQVTMVMPIIPIIPSINTCMTLTTTTTTSTNSKVVAMPEVNTTQLTSLADVCSTVNSSSMMPITNPVMNSLVSPTKVVTNNDILNPITTNAASNIELPKKVPVSYVPVPIMQTKEESLLECCENTHDANNEELKKIENNVASEQLSLALHETTNIIRIEENLPISNIEEDISIENKPQEQEQVAPDAVSIESTNMLDENNLSSLSPGNEPMECSSSLASQISPKDERKAGSTDDVVMTETNICVSEYNNIMQVESSQSSPLSTGEMKEDDDKIPTKNETKITAEDLNLLCDLFYLPFEHGARGLKLLNEFNWLKVNACVLLGMNRKKITNAATAITATSKPEVVEWLQRAETFSTMCNDVQELLKKIACCANKEICYDLFSYVWDVAGALTLLQAYIKWLSLGTFKHNVYTFTQGTYTWFTKGWKEAFMSGDQEPWVFRGGLIADLQRLIPVDSANDLFLYKLPELPTTECHNLRPYVATDEIEIYQLCTQFYLEHSCANQDITDLANILPENLRDLVANSIVGPFTTLSPEMCFVAQNETNNVGFVAASIDVNIFTRNTEICWMTEMREKYSKLLLDKKDELTTSSKLNDILATMINEIHEYKYQCPPEVFISFPAVLTSAMFNIKQQQDFGIIKRLLTVTLAALRANGVFGVHVCVRVQDTDLGQYYLRMGFAEIYRDSSYIYFGRRF